MEKNEELVCLRACEKEGGQEEGRESRVTVLDDGLSFGEDLVLHSLADLLREVGFLVELLGVDLHEEIEVLSLLHELVDLLLLSLVRTHLQ